MSTHKGGQEPPKGPDRNLCGPRDRGDGERMDWPRALAARSLPCSVQVGHHRRRRSATEPTETRVDFTATYSAPLARRHRKHMMHCTGSRSTSRSSEGPVAWIWICRSWKSQVIPKSHEIPKFKFFFLLYTMEFKLISYIIVCVLDLNKMEEKSQVIRTHAVPGKYQLSLLKFSYPVSKFTSA